MTKLTMAKTYKPFSSLAGMRTHWLQSKNEGVPDDENQNVTKSTNTQSNGTDKHSVVAVNLEINGIEPREKDEESLELAQNLIASESTLEIPQGSITE